MPMSAKKLRSGIIGLAVVACAATSVPVVAQDTSEARLRKIEAEIRALQRNVFPGGDGKFFQPEIQQPQQGGSGTTTGAPSSTAVTDILARLDALETQIAQLTSQTEINTNAIAQMQTRLVALDPAAASTTMTAVVPTSTAVVPATTTSVPATTEPSIAGTASRAIDTAPSGPSAERLARVQAIAKPQSDDAGDDEYSYGFRLWDAGLFPEAQQQLQTFVDRYPSHWRTTYGRNLLGRAYLDDGKPREAAPWFLQNYQSDKSATRAGDSLLFLAEAMIAIEDTRRACIALAEFGETYPALASGRLQGKYDTNRSKVSCN